MEILDYPSPLRPSPTTPTRPIRPPTASDLSSQRRNKIASSDMTLPNHLSNVYHMMRRIKELYDPTDRILLRAKYDDDPVHFKGQRGYGGENPLTTLMALPPTPPKGARALTLVKSPMKSGIKPGHRAAPSSSASSKPQPTAHRVRQSLGASFMSGRGAEYHECKKCMLEEIVEKRLYKEAALRDLFTAYMNGRNGFTELVVERVANDLRREFDVRL